MLPPPGAPPRRSPARRWALPAVLLGIVLSAALVGVVLIVQAQMRPKTPATDVVRAFLTAGLVDHDIPGALRQVTSSAADQAAVRQRLEKLLTPSPGSRGSARWELPVSRAAGGDDTTVTVNATWTIDHQTSGPTVVQQEWIFALRVQDRQWRIHDWTT